MSVSTQKVNLLGMNMASMERFFIETLGEKRFRATQVLKWIHQRGVDNFDDMTDVSMALREKLKECADDVTYLELNHKEGSAEQNVNGIVIRSANDDNVHKVRIKLFRPSSMGFGLLRPRIRVKFNSFGRGN